MNVNKLTKEQCIRIIENNYLGAHTKSGKQKDYHDYKDAINARLWHLQDKTMESKSDMPKWVLEGNEALTTHPKRLVDSELVMKVFNKWRYVGMRLV